MLNKAAHPCQSSFSGKNNSNGKKGDKHSRKLQMSASFFHTPAGWQYNPQWMNRPYFASRNHAIFSSCEAGAGRAGGSLVKAGGAAPMAQLPHFMFRVREQLINELGEKAAYRGGYSVNTTLDWNMQQLAEKEVTDHVNGLKFANVNNAALITMDPTTGEILAYVGSKDYYDHSPKVQGDYDVAGIALRQPGSTFKLFTYLTGMLKGGMTASTVLNDIQFNMPVR